MKKKKKYTPPNSGKKRAVAKVINDAKKTNRMRSGSDEKHLLFLLQRLGEESVSSRELMRMSKIASKQRFYDSLRKLERSGDITVDAKHRVKYMSPGNDLKATIVSLSSGFGFARPADGGDDLFIHGSGLKGAFLGDEVLLTNVEQDEKGPRARVRRIEKRSKSTVTGSIAIEDRQEVLIPDGAIRYSLKINRKDLRGAKAGDKVAVKPRQDQRGDWSSAVVTTVFGNSESARVCADAIIERHGIPVEFPEAVLELSEIVSKVKISQQEIDKRADLRGKSIFTIDGADAKDLDDAISVEKIKNGYKLGVHIADVSEYVTYNSHIDKEAYERGTSVYFADRVIPMLPEALSNGACSLNPGTDKLAFSAFINFDMDGEITKYLFQKSVINSKVRGVYSEVNQLFSGEGDAELKKKYRPVQKGLENARALAKLLQKKAKERGEMELESGELKFVLDENGVCLDIQQRATGEAEQLIEQMMISANRAASMFAQKHKLPFLYRIHEKPSPEKVADLYTLLDSLGIACGELKKSNPSTGDFAKVLERVKGTSRELLVSQRILRTMEKARYSELEKGHFGLALQDYSHFTSPIRRYPDLTIHRILSDFLDGVSHQKMLKRYEGFTAEAAVQTSKTEVRAVTAEREAEDCYSAEYMKGHIGENHMGIISGITSRGLFVRLENGVEGYVSFNDFQESQYEFDGIAASVDRLSGKRMTVGDSLNIVVASSQVSSGRIDFVPADQN